MGKIRDRRIGEECEFWMLSTSELDINSGHSFGVNNKGGSNYWKPTWVHKNKPFQTAFVSVKLGRLEKHSRQNIWTITNLTWSLMKYGQIEQYDLDVSTVGGCVTTWMLLIKGFMSTWESISYVLLQSLPLAPSVQHFNNLSEATKGEFVKNVYS